MVTLEEAKKHINVDFIDDDAYITQLINVAEVAVCNFIGITTEELNSTIVPSPINHAMLLIVGNLYATREPVTVTKIHEVPFTIRFLIEPYKNWVLS